MWLKVHYSVLTPEWPVDPKKIKVSLHKSKALPTEENGSFRVSPIFSILNEEPELPEIANCSVYFFCFENPFRALAKIDKIASEDTKKNVWFSIGLSSVVVFDSENRENFRESFLDQIEEAPKAYEKWTLNREFIYDVSYDFGKIANYNIEHFSIASYDELGVTERAVVDEFSASISLIVPNVATYFSSELETFKKLVISINELISEVVYLASFKIPKPKTLEKYSIDDLKNRDLNNQIKHQAIDRIIQVNSALSYVNTQALSGAIPILERRSLIRRHSLLGVGSSILALNRLARKIEQSFAEFPIEFIVKNIFSNAPALPGIDSFPKYDHKDWDEFSINSISTDEIMRRKYHPKLPYFSGRLGFREAEYTISAAIQSISSGSDLSWSLLTITHEMLHGHVRLLLTSIFDTFDKKTDQAKMDYFFDRFEKKVQKLSIKKERQIDSIRYVILHYCCLSYTLGSISREPEKDDYDDEVGYLKKILLKKQLAQEHRNISEIMVHILDLDYFYGSQLSAYIPLIWSSWISIPHVNGDVRQYTLRSLLTIASKIDVEDPHLRFRHCVDRLNELLNDDTILHLIKSPMMQKVLKDLKNKKKLRDRYYPAFKASLILVDLTRKIFHSSEIRSHLLRDDLIRWRPIENSIEEQVEYRLANGFQDQVVESPSAYLFSQMSSKLRPHGSPANIERETAITFLTCNSE